MADDKMKNDDLTQRAGTQGGQREDMGKGQQAPGRNPKDDDKKGSGGKHPGRTGHEGGAEQGGRQGNQGGSGKGDMGR